MKPLTIFIHTPKCGGSTIRRHLEAHFAPEERLALYPHELYERYRSFPFQKTWIDELILSMSPQQRDAIKVVYGHSTYFGIHRWFGREPYYFTFLRDPMARTVSHYRFLREHPTLRVRKWHHMLEDDGTVLPFEKWIMGNARAASNFMTWFLSLCAQGDVLHDHDKIPNQEDLTHAKKMLRAFDFVGILENSAEDMAHLFETLGIQGQLPNANLSAGSRLGHVPFLHDLIRSRNGLDLELYRDILNLKYAKS